LDDKQASKRTPHSVQFPPANRSERDAQRRMQSNSSKFGVPASYLSPTTSDTNINTKNNALPSIGGAVTGGGGGGGGGVDGLKMNTAMNTALVVVEKGALNDDVIRMVKATLQVYIHVSI
jgi:hypothetical protein